MLREQNILRFAGVRLFTEFGRAGLIEGIVGCGCD